MISLPLVTQTSFWAGVGLNIHPNEPWGDLWEIAFLQVAVGKMGFLDPGERPPCTQKVSLLPLC